MTASVGGKGCKFCGKVRQGWGDKFHYEGCPDPLFLNRGKTMQEELADIRHRIAEWKAGYNYGFKDNYLAPWIVRQHTLSWQIGYRIGKAQIDELVELAIERNNSYEYGEEE